MIFVLSLSVRAQKFEKILRVISFILAFHFISVILMLIFYSIGSFAEGEVVAYASLAIFISMIVGALYTIRLC